MANGHIQARSYPVWEVAKEAQIVVVRKNHETRTTIGLTRLAVASLLGKEALEEFKRQMDMLDGGSHE